MQIDKALRGLARNPALPADMLRRLLHHREACGEAAHGRSDLTEEIAGLVLAFDDDWRTHSLACNANLPPGAARAVLGSPDPMTRAAAASRAHLLDEDDLAPLLEDPAAAVRTALAASDRLPPSIRTRLARDSDPGVRAEVAQWWVEAPEDVRRDLLTDDDPAVRAAACSTYFRRLPHPVPPADLHAALLADPATRAGVVPHVEPDAALAKELAADPAEEVRTALAAHPRLPSDVRDALAEDAAPLVRAEILVRADTPDGTRTAVYQGLLEGAARADAAFAVAEHDLMCQIALAALDRRVLDWVTRDPLPHVASPYLCFRHSAALAPDLPAEAVEALLDDEHSRVRHAMAANAPSLTPRAAERLERRHRRDPKRRGRPADHAAFPAKTLRRFATDPDPRIRSLAPRDPDLPPALVARLAADDDLSVRREAACHPNLPATALWALLADDEEDEHVVMAAAGSPAMPVELMERLLSQAGL